MHNFKKLMVWEKAHSVTVDLYRATQSFPKEELYGLTSQIRRSTSSIAANVAEGCGRGSKGDFIRFLRIAQGSAFETQQHLLLAYALEYIDSKELKEFEERVVEVKRMLAGLISKISDG